MEETIHLVKEAYIKFNLSYGNIIDMEKVDNALMNIRIANEELTNVPEGVKNRFTHMAKAVTDDDIVYVKEDVSPDVLFHEVLHAITNEDRGLQIPIFLSYTDEEAAEAQKAYGTNRWLRQIEQLNESMTRFITELAFPDVEIRDSYKYGADIMRKYYETLINNNIDPSFMLNMYLHSNQDDAKRFKKSFGSNFKDFLNEIEKVNNIRFYVLKPLNENNLPYEKMERMVEEAAANQISK